MTARPPGEECVHDAVLVCGGSGCPGGAALVDALRAVVRRTSSAVLVRTGCHGSCAATPRVEAPTRVVLLSTDEGLRPVPGAVRRELAGCPRDLTIDVARWLLRPEAPDAASPTRGAAPGRQRRSTRGA